MLKNFFKEVKNLIEIIKGNLNICDTCDAEGYRSNCCFKAVGIRGVRWKLFQHGKETVKWERRYFCKSCGNDCSVVECTDCKGEGVIDVRKTEDETDICAMCGEEKPKDGHNCCESCGGVPV